MSKANERTMVEGSNIGRLCRMQTRRGTSNLQATRQQLGEIAEGIRKVGPE